MDERALHYILDAPQTDASEMEPHTRRLLELAAARGLNERGIISMLLKSLDVLGSGGTRQMSSGSGNVERIELTAESIRIVSSNGREYTYSRADGNTGLRWRRDGGIPWVSRQDIERELAVWPGYVDALEGLLSFATTWYSEKERELEKKQEALRAEYVTARHKDLKLWRERKPVPHDTVPVALRDIQHLKRLEVNDPCHVYFLLDKAEVVYVGQSTTPWPGSGSGTR